MAAFASSSMSGLVSALPCVNQLRSSRQSFACSTAKFVPEWNNQSYSFGNPRETEKRAVVRCAASSESRVGFFGKLGRVIKEKAKGDIDRLFNGFSKTRENLSVVDELFTYWNLTDSENTLDELEEALLVADFGPRTALKIVDEIRKDILAGKLTTGGQIKNALKASIVKLLTEKISNTDLQFGTSRPVVIMVVGVNGGGKTTTIGKLAHRLKKVEDIKVLMAAGDTFRAAAREQLEIWANRTSSDIEMGEGDKKRPAAGILLLSAGLT